MTLQEQLSSLHPSQRIKYLGEVIFFWSKEEKSARKKKEQGEEALRKLVNIDHLQNIEAAS